MNGVKEEIQRVIPPIRMEVMAEEKVLNESLAEMLSIKQNDRWLKYQKRIKGKAYFELVDEFVMAVQEKYPNALIQFEDFLTPNAYTLLNKYKNRVLCFNDDIFIA